MIRIVTLFFRRHLGSRSFARAAAHGGKRFKLQKRGNPWRFQLVKERNFSTNSREELINLINGFLTWLW
jgi:hypothetical protein